MDDRRGDIQISGTYDGLRLSADEYLRLPDDGHRYELIDGVVLMSPSPRFGNQEVLMLLANQLMTHLGKNPGAGRAAVEVDVRFAPTPCIVPILCSSPASEPRELARPLTSRLISSSRFFPR
jgi:hypothetical protein